MTEAIATGSALVTASAWWRWRNLDKAQLAERMALRLMAKAAGWRAQERAETEAMGKEIILK